MERGEIAEGVAESFPDPETALNAPMGKCCGLAFQSIAASGFLLQPIPSGFLLRALLLTA